MESWPCDECILPFPNRNKQHLSIAPSKKQDVFPLPDLRRRSRLSSVSSRKLSRANSHLPQQVCFATYLCKVWSRTAQNMFLGAPLHLFWRQVSPFHTFCLWVADRSRGGKRQLSNVWINPQKSNYLSRRQKRCFKLFTAAVSWTIYFIYRCYYRDPWKGPEKVHGEI